MISLDMPPRPTTPLSVTESRPSAVVTDARAPARYFLDICAGRSAPLSVAAIKAGLAVLVPLNADPLLGLTDPNVADYVLQLTWSGSIGFAAEAPRRSDPHAEILANRKPWQQNDRLIYQNVTAILTAVHANGGHVLWAIPPFSVAFHMDFMQDFLSNMATYWLWVDACQVDADEDTSPSDFQRTRSLHRRPRCCMWADEVPLRTRFFQHLPGAGAPKQSCDRAIPSLKTRSSELS